MPLVHALPIALCATTVIQSARHLVTIGDCLLLRHCLPRTVALNADLPMCENASGRKTADLGPHPISSAFPLFGVRKCSRLR